MSLFQDLPAAVRRISDFLGRDLSDEAIKKIAEHCSFKTMKVNTMSNFSLVPKKYMDNDKCPFLRKGEAAWVEKSPTDYNTSTYCGPSFETNLVCVFCVRYCWGLEKPFQQRATGPIQFGHSQRDGGRDFLSPMESGLTSSRSKDGGRRRVYGSCTSIAHLVP